MNKYGYFIVQEFVPPEIYNQFGDKSIHFIDKYIIETANSLREYFGTMYINTWAFNGEFRYRGLRPFNLKKDPFTGIKFVRNSEHYFGNAIDFSFKNISVTECFQEILLHRQLFPHIHRMENNPTTWLHIDKKGDYYNKITLF